MLKVFAGTACLFLFSSLQANDSEFNEIVTTSKDSPIVEFNKHTTQEINYIDNFALQGKPIKMIVGGQSENGVAKQITVFPKRTK